MDVAGLATITDYKGEHSRELPSDTSLPYELNYFYARFEANNTETCMIAPAVPEDCVIMLSTADVSKIFKQFNIHMASGSDGLPGRVLRACTDQLARVFTGTSLCNLILDFLTGRLQVVRVGNNTSPTLIRNMGGPSGVRAQSPPVVPVH